MLKMTRMALQLNRSYRPQAGSKMNNSQSSSNPEENQRTFTLSLLEMSTSWTKRACMNMGSFRKVDTSVTLVFYLIRPMNTGITIIHILTSLWSCWRWELRNSSTSVISIPLRKRYWLRELIEEEICLRISKQLFCSNTWRRFAATQASCQKTMVSRNLPYSRASKIQRVGKIQNQLICESNFSMLSSSNIS